MQSCSELLENDHSGRGLKGLKEELFEMSQAIKKSMDQGLSSEEMQIAQALKEAVETADSAVENIYKKATNN